MSEAVPTLSVDAASDYIKGLPGLAHRAEPGFASTYGPGTSSPGGLVAAALPAAGIGALSLYLLYRRKLQDEENARQKQADLQAQLPGLHPKDMLLGAAAGGGAGLLYDLAAPAKPGEKRLPKALKRILGGAAIGGLGANLVGDRLRRYITNTAIPLDYDASDKVKQLMPGSLKRFVDAAILDKPSFDPARVQAYVDHTKSSPEDMATMLGARRELNRIAFGVHKPGAKSDYWQYNKGDKGPGYYSVNESNPEYKTIRDQLFGPRTRTTTGIARLLGLKNNTPQRIMNVTTQDPVNAVAGHNQLEDPWRHTGLFGADTLLGGQHVAIPPGAKYPLLGRVLDRYDMTPAQSELDYAQDAVKKLKILSPEWWAARKDPAAGGYPQTNKEFTGGLLARLLWDKVLTEKHPWVSQQFRMSKAAPIVIPNRVYWPGKFELLKEDGTP